MCDTNCIDCPSYYSCDSSMKLDEVTRDFWLDERDLNESNESIDSEEGREYHD